jgi:hypothetical protein
MIADLRATGRKIWVFTNSDRAHAERTLKRIGALHFFSEVIYPLFFLDLWSIDLSSLRTDFVGFLICWICVK